MTRMVKMGHLVTMVKDHHHLKIVTMIVKVKVLIAKIAKDMEERTEVAEEEH